MRWDDLDLLRRIYEFETTGQTGHLLSGYNLMRAASSGRQIDWNQDSRSFARELLLAHRAGYLEWTDPAIPGLGPVNPDVDPHRWLQHVNDIRLTLDGRDRARGLEIRRPLPDPEEDDDRPITGMTLEEIARAIGDTYTGSQLPRYLHESGVPDEFLQDEIAGSKWEWVFAVFETLHDGGSASRRALRQFMGAGSMAATTPPHAPRSAGGSPASSPRRGGRN